MDDKGHSLEYRNKNFNTYKWRVFFLAPEKEIHEDDAKFKSEKKK